MSPSSPRTKLRVLVLGASGFVGSALVRELFARGHAVEAWSRRPLQERAGVVARRADLLEPASFADARGPWDAVVHLAAHAVPNVAWTPAMYAENVRATEHALAHVVACAPGARFVLGSSAAVYAGSDSARAEDAPLAPRGAYAESKLACEERVRARAQELDVRVARLFNQIGPGMPAGLALSDLCERLARGDAPVRMAGADSERDYLDVRDGARALAELVETPSGGTWNVCSGTPRRISSLADALVRRLGTAQRVEFAAGARADRILGDPGRLARDFGWRAEVPFDRTLDDLAAWVRALARPGARA